MTCLDCNIWLGRHSEELCKECEQKLEREAIDWYNKTYLPEQLQSSEFVEKFMKDADTIVDHSRVTDNAKEKE